MMFLVEDVENIHSFPGYINIDLYMEKGDSEKRGPQVIKGGMKTLDETMGPATTVIPSLGDLKSLTQIFEE